MSYDLSQNDRFFLNQLIPKWESGKVFDLQADLKYVFHREKGSDYNQAQYEYTLKTLKAFLEDNRFAKETRQYMFEPMPKANMLMAKGSIEHFEEYQQMEKGRASGQSIPSRSVNPQVVNRRNDPYYDLSARNDSPPKTGSRILTFIILCVVIALCVVIWQYMTE